MYNLVAYHCICNIIIYSFQKSSSRGLFSHLEVNNWLLELADEATDGGQAHGLAELVVRIQPRRIKSGWCL